MVNKFRNLDDLPGISLSGTDYLFDNFNLTRDPFKDYFKGYTSLSGKIYDLNDTKVVYDLTFSGDEPISTLYVE